MPLPWLCEARLVLPLQSCPHEHPTVRAHPYAREEIHGVDTPQQHPRLYRTGDLESCRQRAERLLRRAIPDTQVRRRSWSAIQSLLKFRPAYVWRTQSGGMACSRGKQMREVRVSPSVAGLPLIGQISVQCGAWRSLSDVWELSKLAGQGPAPPTQASPPPRGAARLAPAALRYRHSDHRSFWQPE